MSDTDVETKPPSRPEAQAANPASDPQPRGGKSKPRPGPLQKGMAMLSSFGFTTLLLIGLMILTFFGTHAQKELGLTGAQQEYFESLFCRLDLGLIGLDGWGMRFPGAFLLLILLSINLLCGGLIRIRWQKRNAGVLIAHIGIVFLLFSGAVEFANSTRGFLRIEEGKRNSLLTTNSWNLVIREQKGDKLVEHVVPDTALSGQPTIVEAGLPFRLKVDEFFDSSRVRESASTDLRVIDGAFLEEQEHDKDLRSIPGAYVTAEVDGQMSQRGILWGFEDFPWTLRVGERTFTVGLYPHTMKLPFEVELIKFRVKYHPRTLKPRHFSSRIYKYEDGTKEEQYVTMNEPLRYKGYTLSQNNWGPQTRRGTPEPGATLYSVLEVSNNPSDQWPKYATFVIALGLLIHFVSKLLTHVKRQQKKLAEVTS